MKKKTFTREVQFFSHWEDEYRRRELGFYNGHPYAAKWRKGDEYRVGLCFPVDLVKKYRFLSMDPYPSIELPVAWKCTKHGANSIQTKFYNSFMELWLERAFGKPHTEASDFALNVFKAYWEQGDLHALEHIYPMNNPCWSRNNVFDILYEHKKDFWARDYGWQLAGEWNAFHAFAVFPLIRKSHVNFPSHDNLEGKTDICLRAIPFELNETNKSKVIGEMQALVQSTDYIEVQFICREAYSFPLELFHAREPVFITGSDSGFIVDGVLFTRHTEDGVTKKLFNDTGHTITPPVIQDSGKGDEFNVVAHHFFVPTKYFSSVSEELGLRWIFETKELVMGEDLSMDSASALINITNQAQGISIRRGENFFKRLFLDEEPLESCVREFKSVLMLRNDLYRRFGDEMPCTEALGSESKLFGKNLYAKTAYTFADFEGDKDGEN